MIERCPHCRRLCHVGTVTDGDPGDRRCIDCWFAPAPEIWVAMCTAVLRTGQTGDLVRRAWGGEHFWPHDDSPEAWKTKPEPIAPEQVAYRHPIFMGRIVKQFAEVLP